jgi:hypothetical protein
MSQGVYTPDLRVKFVKGWHADEEEADPEDGRVECGHGTRYPMEATLDQIAEIYYRVKDAKFTGGYFAGFESYIYAPSTVSENKVLQFYDEYSTWDDYEGWELEIRQVCRGYSRFENFDPFEPASVYFEPWPSAVISAHDDPYLGEEYDAGEGATAGMSKGRDIGLNERGVWCDAFTKPEVFWGWNPGEYRGVQTAFSWSSFERRYNRSHTDDVFYSSEGSGLGLAEAMVNIAFEDTIAVVRANPTDGFFAPTNRYFIGVMINCADSVSTAITWTSFDEYEEGKFHNNYIIRLPSGDLTCPIYSPIYFDLDEGTDIIHEATEWFPYAKNSPATAVWNSATGAKL